MKQQRVNMASNKLDELLNDNQSGSHIINEISLKLLSEQLEELQPQTDDLETLYKSVQATSKSILKQHPTMTLIRKSHNSFFNYFKRLLKTDKEDADVLQSLQEKIEQIIDELAHKRKKIITTGSRIIANSNKVMTISNSNLVKDIISKAQYQKRRFEVYSLISQPPGEGIQLARECDQNGIRTTVIADSQMGVFMEEMNLVIIGADRIYEDGFINKSGTLPLCLVANHYNVPVYLVSETDKILLESQRSIKQKQQNTREVFIPDSGNIHVDNFYFERIPLSCIHKVICEDGAFETFEFIDWYLKE
ncbi:MAG: hypothetical protein GF313_13210 [Caldithrix sp.]|nr:hypothetical protein [Caldithrix sp.]